MTKIIRNVTGTALIPLRHFAGCLPTGCKTPRQVTLTVKGQKESGHITGIGTGEIIFNGKRVFQKDVDALEYVD